jgi:hypothetical protein
MLNLCGIVVAILKMATGRNFSMSGHHYVPTNQMLMQNCYLSPISKWPPQYCKNSSSEFVTMQNAYLNLLSVAGLGDFIIVRL